MHVDAIDTHHRLRREAGRSARHPGPARHGARLDGHLRLHTELPDGPAAPRRRRPELQPRLRQGPDPVHRRATARPWRTASRSPACASSARREAYWRDVGTVDAYWEANIDLTDFIPELDLYDTVLADLDLFRDHAARQVRPRRGRPPRHGDLGWCRATASSRAPSLRRSLLFTGVRANSYSQLEEAVILPDCRDRPEGAAAQGRGRPRRGHPRGPGGRRGSGARRQAVPAHRRAGSA